MAKTEGIAEKESVVGVMQKVAACEPKEMKPGYDGLDSLIDQLRSDPRMSEIIAAQSLGDLFRRSARKWADRIALRVPENGEYRPITYREMYELVRVRAKALHALDLRRGDTVVILGETSLDWALTDWASQTLGLVVAPIYPTLPPDQAAYIVKDSGAKVALVMTEKLEAKVVGVKGLKVVHIPKTDSQPGLDSLAETTELDQETWERGIDSIELEDLATIIYTSGTTGNPKGVMLVHRCFIPICAGIRDTIPVDETDTFFSFLPLSHVFERFAGHVLPIAIGASIAYASSLASISSDIVKVRPTVMMVVPRFLEAIRSRVVDTIAKQSPLKQKLFALALDQGKKRVAGQPAPLAGILDKLVCKKVRERTGGRLRLFVSGGAALAPHVSDFYLAMGFPVLQGYGLTETTAATCVNHPDNNKPYTVGMPIKSVEVKIASDGEIMVKGPAVMKGYFNLPEATKEAIEPDGWFHTGDIGEWDGKHVKITDRKKDILVLANGKNIAPQPIENKLRASDYVGEAVLFGDGMEYVCALVQPSFETFQQYFAGKGLDVTTPEQIAANDETRKMIRAHLDSVNKTLADFEKVKRFELVSNTFSVDTGELTPSLKVRRKIVHEKYNEQIRKMMR